MRQPEPRRDTARALTPSQSNRFVKKPSHSRLGGLQELEFFALFAQHFHVEVTVGFDPVLVDLDRESPDEPQRALLVGKDADDMGAALESPD